MHLKEENSVSFTIAHGSKADVNRLLKKDPKIAGSFHLFFHFFFITFSFHLFSSLQGKLTALETSPSILHVKLVTQKSSPSS